MKSLSKKLGRWIPLLTVALPNIAQAHGLHEEFLNELEHVAHHVLRPGQVIIITAFMLGGALMFFNSKD